MLKLIATDIDGTLLDDAGELPPANLEALRAAAAQGVRLALVTVRKRDSTEFIADQLGLPCGMVCQAGAAIYDADRSPLHEFPIPLPVALQIADLADSHGHAMMITIDEQNYYTPGARSDIWRAARGVTVSSFRGALTAPPTRILLRGEESVRLVMGAFSAAPLRFNRHYRNGVLQDVVISAEQATKETGLALLCARWGIDPEEVLALGDSEADMNMIQMAGVGVAVGNAHPPVLAVADWIAPDNTAAGVAAAVRRYILGGE
jgi:hydroxymethylpyrimidine pyrophosphatase-like HAD family hydrolase